MSWATVIVGAGTAIYKGVKGAQQKKEGNQIISQAGEGIPVEAVQAASEGLPSEQYNKAMRNIQSNQMSALAAAQSRRMGLAAIGGIQKNTNDATLSLDASDANARVQNQQRLLGFKDRAFNRKYNYGMQVLGAGNQNQSGALDDLVSGVGSAVYRGNSDNGGGRGLNGAIGSRSYNKAWDKKFGDIFY